MSDATPESFNKTVVADFRANHGKVGGMFSGVPILLVHHIGARTGAERITPVIYFKLDNGWAVFAANQGSPTHPQWYRNLIANPAVSIEIGDESHEVIARVALGSERTRIRDGWQQVLPLIAQYEASAAPREVPVVILEPAR